MRMGLNNKLESTVKTKTSDLDPKLPKVDETIAASMIGNHTDIYNESFKANKEFTQLELINEGLKGSKMKLAH